MEGLLKGTREGSFDDAGEHPRLFNRIMTISYRCTIIVLLWFPMFFICLPLYLLGLSIWGMPPIISSWSRFVKYFIAAFTAGKSDDNIPFTNRVSVFLIVFTTFLKSPLTGVCWFIDELLFSKYHNVTIEEPIFFVTGWRTGSTQLAYYLEDDKANFVVPKLEELIFPFIWYWKFVVPVLNALTIGKVNTETDKSPGQPPHRELDKRHSQDIQRTGSIDIIAAVWHFSLMSWYLGIDFVKWGFSFVNLIDKPTDKRFSSSLVQYCDSTVKKVLYHRGMPTQRVLVKGHFLMVANELAQYYKGAKFFTVVREPLDRFKSVINFVKVINIEDSAASGYPLCSTTWKVIRDYVLDIQVVYYAEEQSFYEKSQGSKLVIPFDKYVNNLSATLESIYSFCNIPIPSHVLTNAVKIQNTTHNRQKRRASYDPKFNRSLSSLGVDEDKLRDQLADYYQWIKQFDES